MIHPRCGYCRTETISDARFCHQCGGSLARSSSLDDPVLSGEPAIHVPNRHWIRLGRAEPSLDSSLHGVEPHEWDPGVWEDRGFERRFGDAAVLSPYFEVLRRASTAENRAAEHETSFVVLCPTFLRRPLTFDFRGSGWASY